MLAFDIETQGLSPETAEVTCICACDPETGLALTVIPSLTPAEFAALDGVLPGLSVDPETILAALDRADRVCAFHGARFDIPFLRARYGIPAERAGAWMLKLVDVYEATFQAFGRAFGLNALLAANGLPSKTDSGANAILLARQREWRRLGEYCMADAAKTHRVSSLARVALPVRGGASLWLVDGRFVTVDIQVLATPGCEGVARHEGCHPVAHPAGHDDAVPANRGMNHP